MGMKMYQYIYGAERLLAMPMTRGQHNAYRGWETPARENPTDEGYLVERIDGGNPSHPNHAGYIEWWPKCEFEGFYRPVMASPIEQEIQPKDLCSDLTFGLAIDAMKAGHRVARKGWNGKGMFVYYVPANSYLVQTGAAKEFFGEGSMVPYNAYMAIKNVDNTVSTWVPSVNDVLAEDWSIA